MKLNLGSGKTLLDGYENLDGKKGDIIYPLRFDADVADEIRASHVLEHFSHHQTSEILWDWARVLKPGGWLKIAVPDFDWILNKRNRQIWDGKEPDAIFESYLFGGQVDENDYHKALFDVKKLEKLLQTCGLINIQRWTSEIQDCASLPVSLNLMGQKPEPLVERADPATDGCAFQAWAVNGRQVSRAEYEAVQRGQEFGSSSRTQVFAAGRWQDYDVPGGVVECASREEMEAAQRGELQTRTIVSDGKRAAKIALCLSTPRIGFLRPFERLTALAHQVGISVFSGDGVFWHHSLSRSIRNAVEFDFEDGSEGFDFILTADYDTYAVIDDIKDLASLLARSPEADCIVPMQMKRGGTGEILIGGQNLDLTQELVPVETAHFGLTIFRKSFFERMPRPWFYEKPDAEGHWGEGRIDADIGFWLNAKKAKLNVMLAPRIVVGHGQEVVTYPKIENGKVSAIHQAVNDWLSNRSKPESIGVVCSSV